MLIHKTDFYTKYLLPFLGWGRAARQYAGKHHQNRRSEAVVQGKHSTVH
jgi:hypothetical protein